MKVDKIGIEVEMTVLQLSRPVVCSFLPYTKKRPLDIDGNLFHKDASMFEVALRPCSTGAEIEEEWNKALAQATSMLPAGAIFDLQDSVEYTSTELRNDPYASVMGCSSSQSIYPGTVPTPSAYRDNYRYAGMHVSISADEFIPDEQVLALDAVLGIKSVLDWEQHSTEAVIKRRKTYGRAGEFRRKPFGIEYRTLPASAWRQATGDQLFELVDRALNTDVRRLVPHLVDIQQAINLSSWWRADVIWKDVFGGEL